MKNAIITFATLFLFLSVYAQEEKPCLSIGRYNTETSFMCSPRAWVAEGVNDFKEHLLKSKAFHEKYKKNNPAFEFVSTKESVIIYEYKKKISGFSCQPTVQAIIRATSMYFCEEKLRTNIAKFPNEYASTPVIVFRWTGKELPSAKKSEVVADYGGVNAKYIVVKKESGGEFFVAKFTNKTRDQLATVLILTDNGKLIVEELEPGSVLTKKYELKKIEVHVIYRKATEPKPSYDMIKLMKETVHDILEIKDGGIDKSKGKMSYYGIKG